jgi:hypothetical protein
MDRAAAGLVGEGSECFGYDDEISQDHDFGPAVMIWLNDADAALFGAQMQAVLDQLPQAYGGFTGRNTSPGGLGRTGVLTIRGFYSKFTGLDHPPRTNDEWRAIPETNLATVTNGKVFSDPSGEFSAFRGALLGYYPEDIRLKKMAARCFTMAQAGQYNYPRCMKRNDRVAAWAAAAAFMDAAISMIFLMNRRYKPFYKWMHHAMGELPVLGKQGQEILARLVDPARTDQVGQIEWLCALITAELQWQGLSHSTSDFLLEHASAIQIQIKDPTLREMNLLVE